MRKIIIFMFVFILLVNLAYSLDVYDDFADNNIDRSLWFNSTYTNTSSGTVLADNRSVELDQKLQILNAFQQFGDGSTIVSINITAINLTNLSFQEIYFDVSTYNQGAGAGCTTCAAYSLGEIRYGDTVLEDKSAFASNGGEPGCAGRTSSDSKYGGLTANIYRIYFYPLIKNISISTCIAYSVSHCTYVRSLAYLEAENLTFTSLACATRKDEGGADASASVTWKLDKVLTATESTSFSNTVTSGQLSTYQLIFGYNLTGVEAVLIYNGTKHSVIHLNGTNTFSSEFSPSASFSKSTANVTFFWEYNTSGSSFTSRIYNQTFSKIFLTECTANDNIHTLNISILNESAPTQGVIVSSLDQTYSSEFTSSITLNFNFTNTTLANFSLCINPNGLTLKTDFQMDYVHNTVHFTYFATNINLSNVTKVLNLYITDGTTQIVYTVKDIFDDPIANVFITVEKFDVGTNSFKTVEVLKSGSDGTAVGRIVLFTEWYRFTLVYNGITRLVEGPLKLIAATRTFRIDISPGDWVDQLQDATKLTTSLTFINSSKTFVLTWTDNALTLNKICLEVKNITSGASIGEDNCATTVSGSLTQNVGGDVDDQMFIAKAFGYIAGAETGRFLLEILEKSFFKEFRFYNEEKVKGVGIFVTFMLVLAMFFIGLWNPAASIILGILAMGVSRMLGFYYMSWTAFMALVVIGIIIIWKSVRAK